MAGPTPAADAQAVYGGVMAENTKIEWCDATFNPWVGCTKVSPACDHCYAEGWAKRTGQAGLWNGDRRRTREENWRQPLKWEAAAEQSGRRSRVFCASLADVFDNQVPDEWRGDLFELIDRTPQLDWLLLTKRPQNIPRLMAACNACNNINNFQRLWPNVWLGTTIENRKEMKHRLDYLLNVPATVHFLSFEPLLEPLWLPPKDYSAHPIDWVIVGGESGGHARTMEASWARSLRDQCAKQEIAFFMKQMTRRVPIPGDLMVRQFPKAETA